MITLLSSHDVYHMYRVGAVVRAFMMVHGTMIVSSISNTVTLPRPVGGQGAVEPLLLPRSHTKLIFSGSGMSIDAGHGCTL